MGMWVGGHAVAALAFSGGVDKSIGLTNGALRNTQNR